MSVRWLKTFIIILVLLPLLLLQSAAAADKEPLPLYIIERDTLQTRNFTPIINHQTMVVNLSESSLTLEVTSKFPLEKYRKGNGYPAFLDDSLLPDPLFSPIEVTPKKTSYLARPDIITGTKDISFIWKKVLLLPGEAVVGQYDNYFGEEGHFWRNDGFDFLGVKVKTDYRVLPLKGNLTELSLGYEIINQTDQTIKDFAFGIFVPVKQILKDSEVTFFELERICTSPNVEASRITKSDGFGEAADGVGAGINVKELVPGKGTKFFLSIAGTQVAKKGTIWPIISLTGRNMQSTAWPQTTIIADSAISEGRFSYLSYNLVIKDRLIFNMLPEGFKIKKAK
ncbi:MAG: hypothetical protein C0399_05590 [Syntrophus sp. (in: bacteria)]|nr:hypothetical protein [Syntrophus sp. (in: bacteria)]